VPRSGLRAPACTYTRADTHARSFATDTNICDRKGPTRATRKLDEARKFARCLPRRYKTFIAQKHLPHAARHLHANAIASHLPACVFPATPTGHRRLLLSCSPLSSSPRSLRGCLLGLPSLLRLYRTVSALLPVAVTLIALSPQWGTKGETKRGAVRISY